MRLKRTLFVYFALSIFIVCQIAMADDQTLEDMAEDIVPVELQINVNYHEYHDYLAGRPPARARDSTRISFRSSGVYTLVRLKEGHGVQYMAIPGFLEDPQFPEVSGMNVYQTHTCHDDEMTIIGRQSRDLSASAIVLPASGAITLSPEPEGADDTVRVNLGGWEIETDHIPCTTQPFCFDDRTFYYKGTIGEDEEAWHETEEGHLEYRGIPLAVVEWNLLKSLAEGGELPLVIPVSISHTEQIAGEDASSEITTILYTVTGVISPVDELPLEPLAPEPEDG